MMSFDPSDAIINAIMSEGPGVFSSSVNVSMSEKNKKIEQRAALLDAAVQPRKGIDNKGAVTRKDPQNCRRCLLTSSELSQNT